MKKIIIIFIILLRYNDLISQEDSIPSIDINGNNIAPLKLEAANIESKVILRWSISNYLSMQEIYGQKVEIDRAEISNDGIAGAFSKIGNVLPATIESLVAKYGESSDIVKIAKSIGLYKTSIRKNGDEQLNNLLSDVRAQKNYHFGIMLIAELHPEYAIHLGLGFIDQTIQPNKKYAYRIKVKSKINTDNEFLAFDNVFTKNDPLVNDFNLQVDSDCSDKNIVLKINTSNNFKNLVYYNVERKTLDQDWQKLNNRPIIHVLTSSMKDKDILMFHDTGVVKNVIYEYRVQGVDRFGRYSAYSPELKASTCDRTPPPLIMKVKAEQLSPRIFQLSWEYPEGIEDLKGFYIERSYSYDGPYAYLPHSLIDPDKRSFLDTVDLDLSCYYRVIGFDTIGNFSQAIPIYALHIDNIAPRKPIGLTGSIDTFGRVKLKWNLGHDNDIIGYRVYFANQEDHKFTNLTGKFVQDTIYEDTIVLKTITRKIFYKIAALDANYNHSEFSDVLTLTKPDVVPPVMPIIINISTDIHAISINWNNSSSDDVEKHFIYRKTDKTPWVKLHVVDDLNIQTFKDTSTKLGVIYYYSLEAVDSSGLSSGLCKAYGTGALKEYRLQTTARLELSKETDGIKIKVVDEFNNISQMNYILYRYNESNKLEYLTTLSEPDPLEYLDRISKKKEKIAYVLKVKSSDGRQSDLSEKSYIKY
jgi:hypothetical protein